MKPIVNKVYELERFHGKGGWTYIRIPAEDLEERLNGKQKLKGRIDTYTIENYRLMPMGEGAYMLPLKAEIRKAIRKKEGDQVQLLLYPDTGTLKIPDELAQCLYNEPEAAIFFNSLSESERKYYIQWIYSAKREGTKVDRLTRTILKLLKREKFHAGYSKPH